MATDPYPRTQGAGITPILAGAALVLAGYLVLDRAGFFDTNRLPAPRTITPRGDLASFEKTTISIFEQNSPSAVHISTTLPVADAAGRLVSEARSTGSGIIWDEEGYILTNHHVVSRVIGKPEEKRILVRMHTGMSYLAEYIFSYEYLDMAMIRLTQRPRNLRPALIGTSADLKVGQAVFAIGNPFGLEQTLTTGVISALNRSITTGKDVELDGLIQVDAAINPGNSGGLLLDSSGRLIGMTTAIYSQTGESAGIGFAVPIDRVIPKVPRLMERRPPIDAGLGITAKSWRLPLGREVGYGYGVQVETVVPGGGASAAGLLALTNTGGDVIVRADGERIESLNGLYRILEKHRAGDDVPITVARFAPTGKYHLVHTVVTLRPLDTNKDPSR